MHNTTSRKFTHKTTPAPRPPRTQQPDSPDLVPFSGKRLPSHLSPRPPPPPLLPTGSVQELIDTAPGDVECPSCSEPLTVDLSGGSPGADGEDEQEAAGAAETGGRGRGRGRGGKGAAAARGRSRSGGRGGGGRGRGGSGGGEVKGRMAGAVAALEASVRKAKVGSKKGGKPGGGGPKRSVTKHSVINRIDLNKFQSVSHFFFVVLSFVPIFLGALCARAEDMYVEARRK